MAGQAQRKSGFSGLGRPGKQDRTSTHLDRSGVQTMGGYPLGDETIDQQPGESIRGIAGILGQGFAALPAGCLNAIDTLALRNGNVRYHVAGHHRHGSARHEDGGRPLQIPDINTRGNPDQKITPAPSKIQARRTVTIRGSIPCHSRGACFARMRCKVRRCMFRRRAVSDTLRSHCS